MAVHLNDAMICYIYTVNEDIRSQWFDTPLNFDPRQTDAQRIARGSDVEVVDSNQNVVNLSRSLFDSIKSLAKNAFEGTVARPLNSQIDEAISHFDGGVTKDYNAENYVTVDLSPDLGYAKVDGPVLLSEGVIKKTLEDKHYNYVSKENLYNLDKSLRESILAIEGTGKNEGHVSFVINDVSNTGHPLLVAVARKTIRGRDVFEVNNIRSIHEKENIYRAIAAGSRVYLNERSTDFLTSLRLQLPSSGDIGASIPILAQEYLDVNKPKKKDVKQLTDAYFAAHKPQFEQVQLDLDAGV